MAKEKKRGFFSWLGFGQKEQPEQSKAQEHGAATPAEPDAKELIQDAVQRQDEAVIIESEQAADSAVLQDDASRDTANESPEQAITPSTQDSVPAVTAKVDLATEEKAYAQQQERIVTEEVESIEAAIAKAELETSPKETLTKTEEAAYQSERAEMEARIVEEEVASVESLLSETAAEHEDIAPAVAKTAEVKVPATDKALPAAAPSTAESPVDKTKDSIPATEAEASAATLAVQSPANQSENDAEAVVVEEEKTTTAILTAETSADETSTDAEDNSEAEDIAGRAGAEQEKPTREGFFARLKRSLVKTKQNLGSGFMGLFRGKKIDDDLFEELEEQLLIADVGVETTRKIITKLTETASRKQLKDAEALYALLKEEMSDILAKVHEPLRVEGKTPFVILMVGVNGVGKTTTIGKLARQFELEGKSVMLAAGDTFRAAAVEQLQVWGERNNIPVIAQHTGADSASVIFDAIQAAKARHIDVLIADTAGRLQNKAHLMEELKKIVRVMKKLDDAAPHEIMLTLDASTGQNAISQAKLFHEAVGLTGITLTKLDGTAKGGVIFSIADQFGIPIRYIGVGEQLADLRPFNSEDFIEALFARED